MADEPDQDPAALVRDEDAAMVVVTTSDGNERAGCLVGFHSQASIEPFRYVVWLSKANHTYRVAVHATHLGIHLLGPDQHDLAELFGSNTGDAVDKLARCGPVTLHHGVPLLEAIGRRFVGRRTAMVDVGGDHVAFVLEPVEVRAGADPAPVLHLGEVDDLTPGHAAEERPAPGTERAP